MSENELITGQCAYCMRPVVSRSPARARGLALVIGVLTLPVGVLALYASLAAGVRAGELKEEQSL